MIGNKPSSLFLRGEAAGASFEAELSLEQAGQSREAQQAQPASTGISHIRSMEETGLRLQLGCSVSLSSA